jgi:Cysteine-rich secretory protein family
MLAALAQNWSANCVWKRGQGFSSSSLDDLGIGQNLYASKPPPINLSASVTFWFNEKPFYSLVNNNCTAAKVCGHYTQVRSPNKRTLFSM